MFEIGLPNDASMAVRATAIVRRSKAIDSDGPNAAVGQVMEYGAADATDAEHDNVVVLHTANDRRGTRLRQGGTRRKDRCLTSGRLYSIGCNRITTPGAVGMNV
ncbi:MAG TPA: hypothetical protein VH107_05225, partial [Lacipirellulaceae bacterium]|nr:hypothetical protein [Lacipirellulaceae bacterium]